MQLTVDVVKDLVVVLTEVGFSDNHAVYIIKEAAKDAEWAVATVEGSIKRVCSTSSLLVV